MPQEQQLMRPTRAIVDLKAIAHNIVQLRNRIGPRRKLMAVVKADGYGHGAVPVSRTALANGADCLAVALPEEGQLLRQAGLMVPILVFAAIQPREAPKTVAAGLEQTVCSLELAQALNQAARGGSGATANPVKIHLKVDTGMGRLGVQPKDILSLMREIEKLPGIVIQGIFSHLASADEADPAYTERQIVIFDGLTREIEAAGYRIPQKHLANSAGTIAFPQSHYDMVRPGISVYGLYPSPAMRPLIDLQPAMVFRTQIAHLKRVPAGTAISYGCTYVTNADTQVATLPVGYADGYDRLLSNRGYASIRGQKAPVIGRVCMDMIMVDVTCIEGVSGGDEAILFGEAPTADEMAEMIGTINYEIVCKVGKRVPRRYIETKQARNFTKEPI